MFRHLAAAHASSRRVFLQHSACGLGSAALGWLLSRDAARASVGSGPSPLAPKPAPQAARAKAVIFLVMEGGPSHIDTFDPKPALERVDGQVFARDDVKSNQVKGTRHFVRSPFRFARHGQCGREVSELLPQLATCVDDLAVVRSIYADSDNHPAALFQYNTGFTMQGNPSMGSWIVYGLGSENENLPAFVVLRDGKPFGGNACWGPGFLPAVYQGTQFRSGDDPVLDLASAAGLDRSEQQENLGLLRRWNQRHADQHPGRTELAARIAAYELAFRMQTEIPETVDLASEAARTHRLYGLDNEATRPFGQRCLLARRMVERGVRFVQVWSGGWDSHDDVKAGHVHAAGLVDQPLAGLLTDLKQRGLLEETLVVWGGEFGRTPDTTEAAFKKQKPGRDHNPRAMTMWFAGGGVHAGRLVGATDEFGERAVEQRYHLHDVHATLLHLLGLDQETLTVYHGGRFKRLTDTGGKLMREILS